MVADAPKPSSQCSSSLLWSWSNRVVLQHGSVTVSAPRWVDTILVCNPLFLHCCDEIVIAPGVVESDDWLIVPCLTLCLIHESRPILLRAQVNASTSPWFIRTPDGSSARAEHGSGCSSSHFSAAVSLEWQQQCCLVARPSYLSADVSWDHPSVKPFFFFCTANMWWDCYRPRRSKQWRLVIFVPCLNLCLIYETYPCFTESVG